MAGCRRRLQVCYFQKKHGKVKPTATVYERQIIATPWLFVQ